MRSMWKLYPDRLTPTQCEEIITLGSKLTPMKACLGGEGQYDEARISEIAWAHPDNMDWVFVRAQILMILNQANAEAFDVETRWLGSMQYTTYHAPGGHFDAHTDTFFDRSPGAYDRKLSLVVQLSGPSDYDGGDLELDMRNDTPGPDPLALRRRGSVIVFPSLVTHQVTPMTRGTRKSLVAWMEGPQWR